MSAAPHRARRRFGQNFLRDPGIIQRIVRAIAPHPGDRLLEIGPGQGALTAALLEYPAALLALELDRDLIPVLKRRFGHLEHFTLHQGDALELDLSCITDTPMRIVGNLPYNISTPLLFHLLAQRTLIHDMHFMLQKEVVDRLAASPGTKAWGRLGIMTQYYCQVEPLLDVPPEAFHPRPKVQSAVVRLQPHARPPVYAVNDKALAQLVNTAFQQRRKTLRNALQELLPAETIMATGVDPSRRPDTLTLAEFVTLANTWHEHRLSSPDQAERPGA